MLTERQRFQIRTQARRVVLDAAPVYRRARRLENVVRLLLRQPHESDFRSCASLAPKDKLFLDVGANSGVSAVSFRMFNRSAPILSLEPNPLHEQDLRFTGRLVKPFRYSLIGASATDGVAMLYVPLWKGQPITPLATFERRYVDAEWRLRLLFGDNIRPGDIELKEIPVPILPIDALGVEPGFVKIDAEGHEPAVLDGMEKTIERCRPPILMEWSREWDEVEVRLQRFGYESNVIKGHRIEPFDGTNKGLNILCLPSEHRTG